MSETTTNKTTTSTKEKVVVGGAIVGGLIFFGFLTSTCQKPLEYFNRDVSTTTVIDPIADYSENDARIIELEDRVETLKDNTEDEKVIGDLETKLANQRAQAAEDLRVQQERVAELESRLAAKPKVVEVPNMELEAETTALTAKINDLNADLEASQSNSNVLSEKVGVMSAALLAAKEAKEAKGSTQAKLEDNIKNLNADNRKLAEELTKSKEQVKAIQGSLKEGDKMNSQVDELAASVKAQEAVIAQKDGQIAVLNAQVNKLKADKNVFVESADDLPAAAQGLFKDLQTLEGKSADEVSAEYAKYVAKHGATAKMRVKFKSGSSAVSADYKEEIAELTKAADKNTYFFIVGYADQTGSAASNKKLSSSRSTSVAKELSVSAKGFQSAQAVYLGQTDRFGAADENRVVEIWEIK